MRKKKSYKAKSIAGLKRLRRRVNNYVDRALGGAALIAVHEAGALHGHWTEIGERVRVAREAHGPADLLREQLDLVPESRNRLARDQEVRRLLWRGLIKDLAAPVRDLR